MTKDCDQIVWYKCNFRNVVTLLCTFGARVIRHAQIERLCTVAARLCHVCVNLIACNLCLMAKNSRWLITETRFKRNYCPLANSRLPTHILICLTVLLVKSSYLPVSIKLLYKRTYSSWGTINDFLVARMYLSISGSLYNSGNNG